MKTTILSLFILITALSNGVAQARIIDVKSKEEKAPQLYATYYFNSPSVQYSVFQNDSIVLSFNKTNIESAKLELYNNSSFSFIYAVKTEKQEKISFDNGERTLMLNETATKIDGEYSLIQISESIGNSRDKILTLNFEDGSSFSYDIKRDHEKIVLLKQ